MCTFTIPKVFRGWHLHDEIATTPIDEMDEKIDQKGYTYYEETGDDAEPVKNESGWLISPQNNMCANAGEFNLVFDFSKVTQKYHAILKFECEDIYQKRGPAVLVRDISINAGNVKLHYQVQSIEYSSINENLASTKRRGFLYAQNQEVNAK